MSDALTLLAATGPVMAAGTAAAVARVKAPALYWSAVGLPMTAARVASSYTDTMEACGLAVAPSRFRAAVMRSVAGRTTGPALPRVLGASPSVRGLRLRLRLPAGLEPDDVAGAAEALRHAWAVHAVHVKTVRPGVVELRLVGFDVLNRVRMPRRSVSGTMRVAVAMRDDGTAYVRDYRTVPHALNLGATESGKSVYQRNLVAGLAPLPAALVGIDCKLGVELAPFAPRLSALATAVDQALVLLDVLADGEMPGRFELIRHHQNIARGVPDATIAADIWDLPDAVRPAPIVLLVDEIAELLMVAGRADEARRDRIVRQLIRIAQVGRAAGIYLELCGQRFGSELGRGATMLRAQLTGRVVHRVNDEASAEMGLKEVGPAAVAAACAIRADRPGVAVAGDTSGGWSRIRTPHRSLHEVAGVCRVHAGRVPDLALLAPFRPVPPPPALTVAVSDTKRGRS